MNCTEEIDFHHAAEDLRPRLGERASVHDTGVVDEDVDASECVPDGVHRGGDLRWVGDVAGKDDDFDSQCVQLFTGFNQGAAGQVDDGDFRLCPPEASGKRASDSARTSGDDDRASAKVTPGQGDLARGHRARTPHDC